MAATDLLTEVHADHLLRRAGVGPRPGAVAQFAGKTREQAVNQLLGTKTVLNELLAYIDLGQLPESELAPRSRLIMTYALCGFANLGSLGIMIGGLATMAPERRSEIVALGARTLVSGTLATLIAGATVGVLS